MTKYNLTICTGKTIKESLLVETASISDAVSLGELKGEVIGVVRIGELHTQKPITALANLKDKTLLKGGVKRKIEKETKTHFILEDGESLLKEDVKCMTI